jgi:hypothetical protein
MHLVIAFAAPLSAPGREALARRDGAAWLPRLAALLAHGRPVRPDPADESDEWSLTPPHERELARALGWHCGDGLVPLAARLARADGIDVGARAWAVLTPAHWRIGTEQVSLADPAELRLDEADSRALFDAASGLFTSEGFELAWGAATRWYAAHEDFATLRTASLDRVIGRNVDRWLGDDPAARRVRRLQAEVQMLLHAHPVNAAREAQGLAAVNSFWLSGSGAAQADGPGATAGAVRFDTSLRGPALAEDWDAWARAWSLLDEGPIAALLERARRAEPWRLTLCGERRAACWQPAPRGGLAAIRARFGRPDLRALLEAL